jgi:hypothetical protein
MNRDPLGELGRGIVKTVSCVSVKPRSEAIYKRARSSCAITSGTKDTANKTSITHRMTRMNKAARGPGMATE